jgi:hypothetical protein
MAASLARFNAARQVYANLASTPLGKEAASISPAASAGKHAGERKLDDLPDWLNHQSPREQVQGRRAQLQLPGQSQEVLQNFVNPHHHSQFIVALLTFVVLFFV